MTPELAALAATALLQVILTMVAQTSFTKDVGKDGNMGPRDDLPPMSPQTLRMRRAIDNHVENIGLFIIAVLLVSLTGTGNLFTAICAWIFVGARLVYFPAYARAWSPLRSYLYMIGLAATLALILASFF
ncbi:MAPEG family protein [Phaeovulum sp. W22_SRMD_FR3]|uniref:MAPEG family protein n=1 Tax=Phaeovulum sp. W22_SRMD_FR3 TaxID=3240274 RepID=UPI003F99E8F2